MGTGPAGTGALGRRRPVRWQGDPLRWREERALRRWALRGAAVLARGDAMEYG